MSKKHNKNKRETKKAIAAALSKQARCEVCEIPLIDEGGCGGTGLCGPCCTGDASTVGEY